MEDKYILIPVNKLADIKINTAPSHESLFKLQEIINNAKQISLSESDIDRKSKEAITGSTIPCVDMRYGYKQALKDLKGE